MPNLAKRLCEAWVGATVAHVAPELQLWSPSYRELWDPSTLAEPMAVLLQCSWAESRAQSGPSTRVSSAMVREYSSAIRGGSRHLELVRFVLIGDRDENGFPELSSIALLDLIDVIEVQGKGTINAETLAILRGKESPHSGAPMAVPLGNTLMRSKNRLTLTTHSRGGWMERPHLPAYFGHHPTPLAITVPY